MKNNGDIVPFLKQKDYKMINNNLGSGSFGKTVLLQDPFIDELFVAKKYEPEYENIKEAFYKNFLDEIKILYKLNHRNIVRIYNYYAYEEVFTGYILMEYVAGTDIGKFITEYVEGWEVSSIDSVFTQLINGFQYIEEHGIIHRDIREGNILIDDTGTVKIIDFGIGKIFEKAADNQDSLVGEINRAGSDTLPQEYYDGVYTSKTDMFYLAELFSRLIRNANNPNDIDFSHHNILNKMMERSPENRYTSFAEIKDSIDRHDFMNLNISQADKGIYQSFTNSICSAMVCFIDERKFRHEPNAFIKNLEIAIRNNSFEDVIQNNPDVISSIISGEYRYKTDVQIKCSVVKNFFNWFKQSTEQSQNLILGNIIAKLQKFRVEEKEPDLPF